MTTVLVTGGSGFLASHCILKLLVEGHDVRATLRSLSREVEVRAMLKAGGRESQGEMSFFAAELTRDAGWVDAIRGCDFVLHIASPFPSSAPKDENELIAPARDGALRVLRAARDAGVRRVVLTSSFASVGYGPGRRSVVFTEADWTDPEAPNLPYIRSKAIAERAAWEFIKREGGALELSVINPVGIFGPVLGPHLSSSIQIVKRMLDGDMPGLPDVYFGVVDVRDVADLHIRAMTDPAAKGERFIAVAGEVLSMAEVASILHRELGDLARRVPTKRLPSWQVRLASLWNPVARQTAPNLGKRRNSSNQKAKAVLRWKPRSSAEAIIATARSLQQLQLLKP